MLYILVYHASRSLPDFPWPDILSDLPVGEQIFQRKLGNRTVEFTLYKPTTDQQLTLMSGNPRMSEKMMMVAGSTGLGGHRWVRLGPCALSRPGEEKR